jgi:hypothetical protein
MRWLPLFLVLLASALLWLIINVAIPPSAQEFPLNDDWAFTRSAFFFAQGEIHYSRWASMPQIGQWLWAYPFLKTQNENEIFWSLRLSTIVLSWIGVGAFYVLLRQSGIEASRATLAAACLALNPLYFLLAGTYMTDVPALAASLVALALYVQALRTNRVPWWLGAACVATLAAITRQNAVATPLATAVLLWRNPPRKRWLGIVAVIVPLSAAYIVHRWFQLRTDVRPLRPELPDPFLILLLPFMAIHLFGLSALPLWALNPRTKSWGHLLVLVTVMALCAGYWFICPGYLPYGGGLFPYSHNMVSPWGAFEGGYTGQLEVGERPIVLGRDARLALSVLGCWAGAWLVARWMERPAGPASPLWLFTLWQAPFLLIAPEVYDRYLLVLLPGALELAAGPSGFSQKERWLPALTLLGIFAMASLGLTHDWFSWNAARWRLGSRAVLERGLKPWDIEGGFEWNGWFSPGYGPPPPPAKPGGLTRPFNRDWFSHVSGKYALSFSQVAGTEVIDSDPYDYWLPPGRHTFYLIEKTGLPALAP